MATHTLNGTITCGASGSSSNNWNGFYQNTASKNNRYVGLASGESVYYACNIMYSGLSDFSSKPITSITLRIYVSSGTVWPSTDGKKWNIGFKYTSSNGAGATGGSQHWARTSSAAQTAMGTYTVANLVSGSSSASSTAKWYDVSVGTTLPKYGYCIGPTAGYTSQTRLTLGATTTLKIVVPDYVVSYNKGDYGTGTDTSETVEAKDSTTLPGAIFTRTGYTQTGWSTNSNGSTKNYNLNASYTVNAAVTLYPYWEIDTYTVTYNPGQYGSGTIAADTKTYGIDLQLSSSTYSRADYTQTGWSTVDGGSKDYNLGGLYTTDADIILYPYWNRNQFLITYDAVGGTGAPATQYKTPGVDIQLSSTIPTKTGFTFLGWDDSSAAATVDYHPGDTYSTDANLDLYAVWKTAGLWVMGSNLQLKAVPIYVMKQGGLVECQIYIMDSNGHLKRV